MLYFFEAYDGTMLVGGQRYNNGLVGSSDVSECYTPLTLRHMIAPCWLGTSGTIMVLG